MFLTNMRLPPLDGFRSKLTASFALGPLIMGEIILDYLRLSCL